MLAGMLALPGTAFDAVGWAHARDKRGTCDGRLLCAGLRWHDREPLVGVRATWRCSLTAAGTWPLARGFGEARR